MLLSIHCSTLFSTKERGPADSRSTWQATYRQLPDNVKTQIFGEVFFFSSPKLPVNENQSVTSWKSLMSNFSFSSVSARCLISEIFSCPTYRQMRQDYVFHIYNAFPRRNWHPFTKHLETLEPPCIPRLGRARWCIWKLKNWWNLPKNKREKHCFPIDLIC